MKNVFLYCPETATNDVKMVFRHKGFTLVELTDDPRVFWETLDSVEDNGTIAMLSHGDDSGPLLVKGNTGADMKRKEISSLAGTLAGKSIRFYLLSCHTGRGDFFSALSTVQGVNCVAPIGFAVQASGAGVCGFYSKEGNDHKGWATCGSFVSAMQRARNTTPLQISPSE